MNDQAGQELRRGQAVIWEHDGQAIMATVVRVTPTQVEIVCQDANGNPELRCVPPVEVRKDTP